MDEETINQLLAEFPPEAEVDKLSREQREALAIVLADARTRRIMELLDRSDQ